jgi:hypothetical protein
MSKQTNKALAVQIVTDRDALFFLEIKVMGYTSFGGIQEYGVEYSLRGFL